MPKFSECWRCGKKDTSVVCHLCNVAKYCSAECRKNDQARHKTDCCPAAVIKQCTTCGKTGSNLKTCSVCLRNFYCDSDCQKRNWPEHMSQCKKVARRIKLLAKVMSPSFNSKFLCIIGKRYYWGNCPAFDCLNLEENEGEDFKSSMNVLFLGVGDVRNVALTCASLPESYKSYLKFTLNDIDGFTLARLVLLLYMLIKGESGIEKTVTEVWYSILLSDPTYTSLCTFLRELIHVPSSEVLSLNTSGLLVIDEKHLTELKSVWKMWLDLHVRNTTWLQEQRMQAVNEDPDSSNGKIAYYNSIPTEHVKSAKKWMKDGIFCQTKLPLVAENPTLTGSQIMSPSDLLLYSCPSDLLPFTGWDYLQVKKFTHCNSLSTMYGAYIENVLQRFKQKLSTKHVSFQAILGNCMEIDQFLEPGVKYDRILTSNLIDYIPIPRLLKLCSRKLNHCNPSATIVTETQNWVPKFCQDANACATTNNTKELIKTALEDTHNFSLITQENSTSIQEYLDNSAQFLEYLRASFHAQHLVEKESRESKCCKLPSVKELGNNFQLCLRDFRRNENRLVFFKMAVNCRRVNMVTGYRRSLEWVPL